MGTWDGEAALGTIGGGPRIGEGGEQGLRLRTHHAIQGHTLAQLAGVVVARGEPALDLYQEPPDSNSIPGAPKLLRTVAKQLALAQDMAITNAKADLELVRPGIEVAGQQEGLAAAVRGLLHQVDHLQRLRRSIYALDSIRPGCGCSLARYCSDTA